MRTSMLTGAVCAATALMLAGCQMQSGPAVTRAPEGGVVTGASDAASVPAAGFIVGFFPGQASFTPDGVEVLHRAALWIKADPDRCLVVDAQVRPHADRGEQRLAEARMEAVKSYVAQQQIPSAQVREGAMRAGLPQDTALLRSELPCDDGQPRIGRAAATQPAGPLALMTPTRVAGGAAAPSSSDDPGTSSPGGEGNAGTTDTSSSGGSSGSGGTGGSGTGSDGTGGSEGGSTDAPGNSGTTAAADRNDAGRGNGSENDDPGKSGARNQGGDE